MMISTTPEMAVTIVQRSRSQLKVVVARLNATAVSMNGTARPAE